jgi:hypothetical protein
LKEILMDEWSPEHEPEVLAAIEAWRGTKAAFDDHTTSCQACWMKPLQDTLQVTMNRMAGMNDGEMPTSDYCPEGARLRTSERQASFARWAAWNAAITRHEGNTP